MDDFIEEEENLKVKIKNSKHTVQNLLHSPNRAKKIAISLPKNYEFKDFKSKEDDLFFRTIQKRSEEHIERLKEIHVCISKEVGKIKSLEKNFQREVDSNETLLVMNQRLDRTLRKVEIEILESKKEQKELLRKLRNFQNFIISKDEMLINTLKREEIEVQKLTGVINKFRTIERERWKYLKDLFVVGDKTKMKPVDIYNCFHEIYLFFETLKPKRIHLSKSYYHHAFPEEEKKLHPEKRYVEAYDIFRRLRNSFFNAKSKTASSKDIRTFQERVVENHKILMDQNLILLEQVFREEMNFQTSYLTQKDVEKFLDTIFQNRERETARRILKELYFKILIILNKNFNFSKSQNKMFNYMLKEIRKIKEEFLVISNMLKNAEFLKNLNFDYITDYFGSVNSKMQEKFFQKEKKLNVKNEENLREIRKKLKAMYENTINELNKEIENIRVGKGVITKQQEKELMEKVMEKDNALKLIITDNQKLKKKNKKLSKAMETYQREMEKKKKEFENGDEFKKNKLQKKDEALKELELKMQEMKVDYEVKIREYESQKKELFGSLESKDNTIMELRIEKKSFDKERDDYEEIIEDLKKLRRSGERRNSVDKKIEERREARKGSRKSVRMRNKAIQTIMNLERLDKIIDENVHNKKVIMVNSEKNTQLVEIINDLKEEQEKIRKEPKKIPKEPKKTITPKKKVKKVLNMDKDIVIKKKIEEKKKTPPPSPRIVKSFMKEKKEFERKSKNDKIRISQLERDVKGFKSFLKMQKSRIESYRRENNRLSGEMKKVKTTKTFEFLKKKDEDTENVVKDETMEDQAIQTDFSCTKANVFSFLHQMTQSNEGSKKKKKEKVVLDKLMNYSFDDLSKDDVNKVVGYMLSKYERLKKKKKGGSKYSFDNYNRNMFQKFKNERSVRTRKRKSTPTPKVQTFEDFEKKEKGKLEVQKKKRVTLPQIYDFTNIFDDVTIKKKRRGNRKRLKKMMILTNPENMFKTQKTLDRFNKGKL